MANTDLQKVITGKVRFSYVHVWEPTSINDGEDKKYSVSLIIPKADKKTIAKINQAIEAAKEAGKTSKFKGKIPAKLKTPLRDGDEERPEDEAYANSYFLNASAYSKPGVVDRNINPILDQDEFYSGCYGVASITLFPFNANGNMGIAAGLNHVMKTADGEPLGGRSTAESDFAELADAYSEEEDDDLLG